MRLETYGIGVTTLEEVFLKVNSVRTCLLWCALAPDSGLALPCNRWHAKAMRTSKS